MKEITKFIIIGLLSGMATSAFMDMLGYPAGSWQQLSACFVAGVVLGYYYNDLFKTNNQK